MVNHFVVEDDFVFQDVVSSLRYRGNELRLDLVSPLDNGIFLFQRDDLSGNITSTSNTNIKPAQARIKNLPLIYRLMSDYVVTITN